MIVTLDNYQRLATRTMRADNLHLASEDAHLLLFAAKLCGEAAELTETIHVLCAEPRSSATVLKEMGDVCWYAAALGALLDLPFDEMTWRSEVTPRFIRDHLITLQIATGAIAEHIGKYVGHGHALDKAVVFAQLCRVVGVIRDLGANLGHPLVQVLGENILKLQSRYPAGFSEDASRDRVA